jgi:hypothetical protein
MPKEIDAAHVLSSYSSLLARRDNRVVRDVHELPYPKEVIKAVLVHCMKLTKPGEQREFLKSGYVWLATFQTLTGSERASMRLWEDMTDRSNSANLNREELLRIANDISESGEQGLEVQGRASTEAGTLLDELRAEGL